MHAKASVKSVSPTKENIKRREKPTEEELKCFRCGVCCTKYHVHVSSLDAQRIVDVLGITWEEWLDKYTEPRWPRCDSYLLKRRDSGACIFLDEVEGNKLYTCRIHPFRPSSCREWSAGLCRQECITGLKIRWGLSIDQTGEIKGTIKELANFYSFLKLLYPPADVE